MKPPLHETIAAKLRKIQALAQSGYAGEKDNAQRLLTALLEKHGLTEADLTQEIKTDHYFTVKPGPTAALLIQIICMILDVQSINVALVKTKRAHHFKIPLTHLENADITAAYAHYLPMLQADLKRLRLQLRRLSNAFFSQYEIFSSHKSKSPKPLTPAQYEAMLANMRQMNGDKWQKPHGSLPDTLQLDFSA